MPCHEHVSPFYPHTPGFKRWPFRSLTSLYVSLPSARPSTRAICTERDQLVSTRGWCRSAQSVQRRPSSSRPTCHLDPVLETKALAVINWSCSIAECLCSYRSRCRRCALCCGWKRSVRISAHLSPPHPVFSSPNTQPGTQPDRAERFARSASESCWFLCGSLDHTRPHDTLISRSSL